MLVYPRANPAKWWKTRSVGSAHRSPRAMFISPLRKLTSITGLVVVGSMVGGIWYLTNSNRISAMSQALLSHILGGQVHVGSGHLSFAGTLRLSDVTVTVPRSKGPALFSADQLEVRFEWLSLLNGELRAQQVVAIRPTLNLVQDKDKDQWNYEQLALGGGGGGGGNGGGGPAGTQTASPGPGISQLPVMVLREATVQWGEIDHGVYRQSPGNIVDGQLQPQAGAPMVYDLQIDERAERGLPGVTLTGTWNVATNSFSATASNVALDQRLKDGMPFLVRQWWDEYHVTGKLASLRTTVDPATGRTVEVNLEDIAMEIPLDDGSVVPINNVNGTLAFSDAAIHVDHLRGFVFGQGFVIDEATLNGYAADAPFTLRARLPNMHLTRDWPALVRWSDAGAGLIERLRPTGDVGISLNVSRAKAGGDVAVVGALKLIDLNARFAHFPFPMKHLHGDVTFDNKYIHLKNIVGIAEGYKIRINGSSGTDDTVTLVDVHVSSDRIPLDDRVAASLPDNIKPVWELFRPHGFAAFDCTVERKEGDTNDPSVTVKVKVLDAGGKYEGFPYPLEHMHGSLTFTDKRTVIDELAGPLGDDPKGHVQFAGVVDYADGNFEHIQPKVTLKGQDIRLNQKMIDALPADYRKRVGMLNPQGHLNLDGLISRGPDGDPLVTGDFTLVDGTLRPRGSPWAVTHANAVLTLSGTGLAVKNFRGNTGADGKGELRLNATVDQSVPTRTGVTATAEWDNVVLPTAAPTVLPAAFAEKWDTWKPGGALGGDMDCALHLENPPAVPEHFNLSGDAATPGTQPVATTAPDMAHDVDRFLVHLNPQGMSIAPAFFPEPVRDIVGKITLTPDGLDFPALSASAGPMRLNVKGTLRPAAKSVTLSGTVAADAMPVKWFAVLPGKAGGLANDVDPAGGFVLKIDSFTRTPDAWAFQGGINVASAKVNMLDGIRVTNFNVAAKGRWGNGSANAGGIGLDLDAMVNGEKIDVAGRPIEDFQTRVISTADHQAIAATDIQGKIATGGLQGNMLLQFGEADKYKYRGNLVLSDAELAQLLHPGKPTEESKKLGTGKVSGEIAMEGVLGEPSSRAGRGSLVVRDANLFHVPLAMGLIQLATLRLPLSGAFHGAEMAYYIQNNKVTFEHILLSSPGVNLAGLGTLMINDKALDLQFVTQSPHAIFTLPVLTALLTSTRNQLLQVHVTGTVDNPSVQPVPFNSFTTMLRRLLPGTEKASDE